MKINNVLIVEDDSRIANILLKTINNEDEFEVAGIAESALQAIDFIDGFAPELVFLDVSLVDSNGLDVLKYIRQGQKASEINVVLLTASKDSDTIQEAMSYGAFDYILKPIAFSRLQATLHRFIKYTHQLEVNQSFEQDELDALFHNKKSQTKKEGGEFIDKSTIKLPKGIDSITLDKIRNIMQTNALTPFTAESMSEHVGTSRTTARRYLECLLDKNEIIADIEYGTVGRPERNYRLKP